MSKNQVRVRVPIMLDSGAFSAWRQGGKIDLKEYMKYLRHVLDRFPEADFEYVNLDVIGDGKTSFRNWMTMRGEGFNPLPIFHPWTEEKWLAMYRDCTDRIGLSTLGSKMQERRILALDRVWWKYLVDKEGMPTARVHGMGVSDFHLLRRYPWWSVDSTSWLMAAGMGDVYIPVKTRDGWAFDRPPKRLATTGPVMIWDHNDNLVVSNSDQQIIEEYLAYAGEPYDGEDGVKNHWAARRRLNIRFFWEFFKRLTWPRPSFGERISAIWERDAHQIVSRPAVAPTEPGHTILFLSGSGYWKTASEFMKLHSKFNWLGRLTSFWELDTPGMRARLLEDLLVMTESERKRK
jgi:hypothetical protein